MKKPKMVRTCFCGESGCDGNMQEVQEKKVSEEHMIRMIADCKHQWLVWFDDILRNDGFAISFQSMGQYRNGLRKAIKNEMEAL